MVGFILNQRRARCHMLAGVVAGTMLLVAGTGRPAQVRAEDAPLVETVLAFRISADAPVGRTFSTMVVASTPGTPPAVPAPLAGPVEVCVRGPEAGGRVVVLFDDDTSVDVETSGCQTVTLTNAASVSLQSGDGTWDVVVRRAADGAGAGRSYLTTQLSAKDTFGRSLSLMRAPAGAAGSPPEAITPYSGALEVCVTTAEGPGGLMLLLDDAEALRFSGTGCQQTAATGASSATFVASGKTWNVVVRPVG